MDPEDTPERSRKSHSLGLKTPEEAYLWLVNGFACYEFGEASIDSEPFAGARKYIHADEQLIESLAKVFEMLPVAEQHVLCAGTLLAVQRLRLNDERASIIAERLITFASAIGAKDAILAFARLLDLKSESEETKGLFLFFFEGLTTWPIVLDSNVEAAVNRLAGAKSFGEVEARRALLVLCRAAPEKLVSHLQLLHPFLQSRYGPEGLAQGGKRRRLERNRRVNEVLNEVTDGGVITQSVEAWQKRSKRIANLNVPRTESSDWWVASLEEHDIRMRLAQITEPLSMSKPTVSFGERMKKMGSIAKRFRDPKLSNRRPLLGGASVVDEQDRAIAESKFADEDVAELVDG